MQSEFYLSVTLLVVEGVTDCVFLVPVPSEGQGGRSSWGEKGVLVEPRRYVFRSLHITQKLSVFRKNVVHRPSILATEPYIDSIVLRQRDLLSNKAGELRD